MINTVADCEDGVVDLPVTAGVVQDASLILLEESGTSIEVGNERPLGFNRINDGRDRDSARLLVKLSAFHDNIQPRGDVVAGCLSCGDVGVGRIEHLPLTTANKPVGYGQWRPTSTSVPRRVAVKD